MIFIKIDAQIAGPARKLRAAETLSAKESIMQDDEDLIDLGAVSEETQGIPGGWYEDIASETHME
jgi:hypothetical protein